MRRFSFCLLAIATANGCVVAHDLGENETEGRNDNGAMSESTAQSGADPSASGAGDATSLSGTQGAQTDDGSDFGGTSSPVDKPPEGCGPSSDFVRWPRGAVLDAPVPGLGIQVAVVLGGTCNVPALDVTQLGEGYEWDLDLSCPNLSGESNGSPINGLEFSPVLQFTSALDPAEILPVLGDTVQLRLVTSWWGMGWDSWFVLTNADGDVLLDGVSAQTLVPSDAPQISDAVVAFFGAEGWHGAIGLDTAESECVFEDKCGAASQAIALSWNGVSGPVLEPGQSGGLATDDPNVTFKSFLTEATAYSGDICPGMPPAQYSLVTWRQGPG